MEKSLFEQLAEEFFKGTWGDEIEFDPSDVVEDITDELEIESKVASFTVNDVVTSVEVYFNKEGYPVRTETEFVKVINLKDHQLKNLKDDLNKAISDEDYDLAKELKTKIDELQK